MNKATNFKIVVLLACLVLGISPHLISQNHLPDSLLRIIEGLDDPTARLEKLSTLAEHYRSYDPSLAILLSKKAITLAEEIGDKEKWYLEKMYLADAFKLSGKQDSMSLLAAEILADASQEEAHKALKYAYNFESSRYLRKRDLDSALMYAQKCQLSAAEDGNTTMQAVGYNMMGNIYRFKGMWEQALDAYLKCLELFGTTDRGRTAVIYNNLGPIYSKLGEHEKTLFYLKKSLTIRDSLGMQRGRDLISLNMGLAYGELADFTRADSCFDACMQWCIQHESWRFWGDALIRQADVALEVKNPQKALRLLEQIPRKYPSPENRVYSYLYYQVKGEALLATGRTREAILAGTNSLEKAKASKSSGQRLIAYHFLKAAHAQARNFEEAYRLAKIEENLRDSLLDVEKVNALADMEAKYQNEKKQAQLELNQSLLAQEQAENAQKTTFLWAVGLGAILLLLAAVLMAYFLRKNQKLNFQLKRSNDQKASLLKEIHHRVKNNLQVISSLLELQARQEPESTVRDSIAEGRNRVKSMALIHQKLYQTEDLAEVDFQDYLEQLVKALDKSFQRKDQQIHTHVIANDIKLDIDTAVPLGLIVNELVTNAYKYAFPERKEGNIQIRIDQAVNESQSYLLTISDDGIGLPAGFSAKKARSLGLRLVNILSKQLKGQLEVYSEKGAHFKVAFTEKSARLEAV